MICAYAAGQRQQQYTTPVPILKQINRHNEDGSYSYGYEAADGSYKIESKYPNGEVYGKYGYIDDQGKLREIEYGASRRGFEPAGNEVLAAPPTINNNYPPALGPNEEDDGQYREDPSVYYKDEAYNNQQQPVYQSRYTQPTYQQPKFQQTTYQQPAFKQPTYQQPAYQKPVYQQPTYQQPAYQQPAFRPQTTFNSFQNQPYYNPAPPAFPNYNQFSGHPAQNIDINTGSYTVQYKK